MNQQRSFLPLIFADQSTQMAADPICGRDLQKFKKSAFEANRGAGEEN